MGPRLSSFQSTDNARSRPRKVTVDSTKKTTASTIAIDNMYEGSASGRLGSHPITALEIAYTGSTASSEGSSSIANACGTDIVSTAAAIASTGCIIVE